ncbi:hypothetical protein B0H21DRAFT_766555 [Amylocystis lapponica]|nr:hypothetical protein B0H21DRAFT_766555 [Amylocystis lapponica]
MGCCQDTPPRQITVVTGANGVWDLHRLLLQLSQPNPPDAVPYVNPLLNSARLECHDVAFDHLPTPTTIIMACRHRGRAETARAELYAILDKHISTLRAGTLSYRYAVEFRQHLEITVHLLDLSDVRSILHFGKEVSQKCVSLYIPHNCNAGLATYSHLDIPVFLAQCCESPLIALSKPEFNVQTNGSLSGDNLGLVWQCNVFGHYVLTDWQLINTYHSYQASKYQIDVLAMELAMRSQKTPSTGCEIRHLLTRMLGSPHVSFSVLRAAVSAVHLTLVDLAHIPAVVYTTVNDRLGRESHPDEGALLLERCERLYQSFVEEAREQEKSDPKVEMAQS